ncbi:MAG: aldo/keto reductase [Xanthomonadales bacterium]|nr:aldo/keto reductase [Xanthomonadales bacterium]
MKHTLTRRALVRGLAAASLLPLASRADIRKKPIPSSGIAVPVIGLGSWLTFDVGAVPHRRDNVRAVIQAFFDRGGGMIDSSPMYSTSQEVIGAALEKIDNDAGLFSATKVWIPGRSTGIWQMERALELWGLDAFDLLYVHNLLDWQAHLPWLREWKAAGRVRHIGVTTSHGRRHQELIEVMRTERMDCVQFTYNIADREAERRLLPLAQDRGLAVVINRPFRGGSLFRRVRGRQLPDWAAEIQVENWAQFFLKFIVSHPAVTCAIPATSQVAHLHENMGASQGPLPDAAMRREMIRWFEAG